MYKNMVGTAFGVGLLGVLMGVQTRRVHKQGRAICVVRVEGNHNGQGDMNDIRQFDNITHTVADDLKG